MKLFTTRIQAIKPSTGELVIFCGPHVPGINIHTAQEYCEMNGLGYCKVVGELVAAFDISTGKWNDYDLEQLN